MRKGIILSVLSLMLLCTTDICAENNKENKEERTEQSSGYPFDPSEDSYAKDKNNVFCNGVKIVGATPNSFVVLKDGYTKDRWYVYYRGMKIEGQTDDTFNVQSRGYAKDRWKVYYEGKILKDVDTSSFVVLQ